MEECGCEHCGKEEADGSRADPAVPGACHTQPERA